MPLSDATCKNAKPRDKTFKLFDGGGLYLEVAPSGSKYWRYKYRMGGKEKRLALGIYPRVTIKEARESHHVARKLVGSGSDPSSQKRLEKRLVVVDVNNTFKIWAEAWFENFKSGWAERHSQNIYARIKNDLYPELGGIPISQIDRPFFLEVIRKIEQRGAPDLARRTAQYTARIIDFAMSSGVKLQTNPAMAIGRLLKP